MAESTFGLGVCCPILGFANSADRYDCWRKKAVRVDSSDFMLAKNMRTRCEGLSLALFLFAIAGNASFVLSICVISLEWRHLLVNASWLAGSGLCIFADIYVSVSNYGSCIRALTVRIRKILSQFFRFQAEDRFAATARLENGLDA